MNYVYHGSRVPNLKVISKHKSTHMKEWVYACHSKAIATIFLSKQGNDLFYSLSGDGKNYPVILVERKPDMFKKIFNCEYFTSEYERLFGTDTPIVTIPACINGISMYMDIYYLNGDYLIIAPNGSSGATFHQKGMFAVDKQIKVLQLKKDKKLKLDLFAVCCDYFLKQKYSYTNCLTEEKILQEVIYYPVVEFTE